MRDADGGLHFVDVLAAGSAGPKGVDPQVFIVDHDVDIVVQFRIHEDRRERGVASLVGIKRRDPHQPVYPGLRLEVAVGVGPVHRQRDALDSRFIARLEIQRFDLIPLSLGPARVHA